MKNTFSELTKIAASLVIRYRHIEDYKFSKNMTQKDKRIIIKLLENQNEFQRDTAIRIKAAIKQATS